MVAIDNRPRYFCQECGWRGDDPTLHIARWDTCKIVDRLVPAVEVRTISKTGGEKGTKPQRYSLIPKAALDTISEIYDFGTKKYSAHNWRKGYEWSKSYDALQRHLTAWWEREENDPESGLSHLSSAGFHLFALIAFSKDKRYAEYDDRYNPED